MMKELQNNKIICLGCNRDISNYTRTAVRTDDGKPSKTPYRWRTVGYKCERCENIDDETLIQKITE